MPNRNWYRAVVGYIADEYERLTGRIQLTLFTDGEEDALAEWYREGVKPKVAANRILDARRKP